GVQAEPVAPRQDSGGRLGTFLNPTAVAAARSGPCGGAQPNAQRTTRPPSGFATDNRLRRRQGLLCAEERRLLSIGPLERDLARGRIELGCCAVGEGERPLLGGVTPAWRWIPAAIRQGPRSAPKRAVDLRPLDAAVWEERVGRASMRAGRRWPRCRGFRAAACGQCRQRQYQRAANPDSPTLRERGLAITCQVRPEPASSDAHPTTRLGASSALGPDRHRRTPGRQWCALWGRSTASRRGRRAVTAVSDRREPGEGLSDVERPPDALGPRAAVCPGAGPS